MNSLLIKTGMYMAFVLLLPFSVAAPDMNQSMPLVNTVTLNQNGMKESGSLYKNSITVETVYHSAEKNHLSVTRNLNLIAGSSRVLESFALS